MPICTSCTHITPYLYTVYESEYNLRLEQCPNCREFVDPYVEHDTLTILLDLILLKLGVYRHLLYNRGAEPRRLQGKGKATSTNERKVAGNRITPKELDRWMLLIQLGAALIFTDACIRSNYLNSERNSQPTRWTKQTVLGFLRILFGTAAETLAFHGGVTFACYLAMRLMTVFQSWFPPKSKSTSNIRQEFRLSMISFSLFYASITKLFLLFLLTIWLPTSTQSHEYTHRPLPDWANFLSNNSSFVMEAFKILDDEGDREWIVRNVLGGMSAGFGLRVILDLHPFFTTLIILAGWAAKTAVAALLSGWVGGNEGNQDAWLAYSIP
ncbi:Arv1-domain-containing protein [Pholiota conissans]|uniref:Protein ARV n=1 Tax=Pholiota conissans TaxID=109636 RepID=A0A9P5ZBS7_9AGAR|nr:Arv1-domain-containing protein [Pholiota conissans]